MTAVSLRSALLSQLAWIDHGFGTRHAPLSQDEMASLRQIHSATTLVGNGTGCLGEGDALITNRPGLTLSVRTADCFPVLLADIHHHAVAAIHAGWRGTAARIVTETLETMHREYGTMPADVFAAIGPGIGACCYKVGPEVARLFQSEARLFQTETAGYIDLAKANRAQLILAGVPEARIDVLGLCTFCDAGRFYSFRRDGEKAGRMISFIAARN